MTEAAIGQERSAPSLGATCSDYLTRYRTELTDALTGGESGISVSRRYARSLDGLVGALSCASIANENHLAGETPRLVVAAVGGYGRGLVALHSDVDILFLCEDSADPRVHRIAQRVLYPLWDTGLAIGHAVRTIEETIALAKEDLPTATTLLDLRWITGEAGLLEVIAERAQAEVFGEELPAVLDALREDMERRHVRSGDSPFLLEPDVKLGRGGLRDLDVATWVARARWGARTLQAQVAANTLSSTEAQELEMAAELLWRVRNLLHRRAQRKHDRLTFPDQEDVAEELGFVDGMTLAVEQFMQAYYRHARVVARTAERLLERARPEQRDNAKEEVLEAGAIALRGGKVVIREDALKQEPTVAFRALRWSWDRQAPLHSDAKDWILRLSEDSEMAERLRTHPEAAELFRELICRTDVLHVRGGSRHRRSLVSELHELGLLVAMIPEFGPITARVQHDAYHLYTVDVHAVRAVEFLAALTRGEGGTGLGLARRLATEEGVGASLTVAALLHGLDKSYGIPVRERAREQQRKRGARMARRIGERLGFSPVELQHLAWLVEDHLALYQWATRRDTTDPVTVQELSDRLKTVHRLNQLYLLTVSVVATTNAREMTAWKARLLEDIYWACQDVLSGAGDQTRQDRADALRDEVRDDAGRHGSALRGLEDFLDTMPDRYLLSNPVETIRLHAELYRRRGTTAMFLGILPGPTEDVGELVLFAPDRAGLLADVTAVLTAHRLAVVQAQVYTRKAASGAQEAIDLFHVQRRDCTTAPVSASDLESLQQDLEALMRGRLTADALAARVEEPDWARRPVPEVETEVVVDNSASLEFTVIEVFAHDRPGLLHAIASRLKELGLSVALSKIMTEGARAADVFYVKRIEDEAFLKSLPEQLRSAINQFQER